MDLVELRDLVISLEILNIGLEGLKLVLEVLGLLEVGKLLPLKERLHLIPRHELVTKHVPGHVRLTLKTCICIVRCEIWDTQVGGVLGEDTCDTTCQVEG